MFEQHKHISWHHSRPAGSGPGPVRPCVKSCCYLFSQIVMCAAAVRPLCLDHMCSIGNLQPCLPCSGGNVCWCVD
jgi:hypothetical protein